MSLSQQFSTLVRKSQKILLATGDGFTGDGLCAMLALQRILQRMGKEVMIVKPDMIATKFSFLKGKERVRHALEERGDFIISIAKGKGAIKNVQYTLTDRATEIILNSGAQTVQPTDISFHRTVAHFDMIIVLGTARLLDLGTIFAEHTEFFSRTPIINIAAGADNEFFGQLNIVDLTKTSACEILFGLTQADPEMAQHYDIDLATILLTGIISATESFLDITTTASALDIAGSLQRLGAAHSDIIEHLFKMKRLPQLKIWGTVLEKMEVDLAHRFARVTVTESEFLAAKATIEDLSELPEAILCHIRGTDLVALLLESPDQYRLQIRTSVYGGPSIEQLLTVFGGTVAHHGVDVIFPKNAMPADIFARLIKLQAARYPQSEAPLPEKPVPSTPKKEQASRSVIEVASPEVPFSIAKRFGEESENTNTPVGVSGKKGGVKNEGPSWIEGIRNKE